MDDHRADQQELRERVQFADRQRRGVEAFDPQVIGDRATDDDQIPRDHQRHQPARQLVQPAQRQNRPDQQQLVGDGIEQTAQFAGPAVVFGQEAIQRVGDASDHEQRQRRPVALLQQQPQKGRHQQDAQTGDQIGDVAGFERQWDHGGATRAMGGCCRVYG